ncbi:MAG: PaaI family thioesterase [Butyricicoccus sp.]
MADILQHLKTRHEGSRYHQFHGLKILSLADGYAEVFMPASPDILNPLGNVHGGAIYTLCDVAAGTAAASRGRAGVTLSSSMSYLRPGHAGEGLLAKTRELKHGRTTAVYLVDVYQGDRLIANGQFTMYYTGETIEVQ